MSHSQIGPWRVVPQSDWRREQAACFLMLGANMFAVAVGVGSHPPADSPVRRAHARGGCSDHETVVTEPAQLQCRALDGGPLHVLSEDAAGADVSHDHSHSWPEVLGDSEAVTRRAERLAREPAGDQVDASAPRPTVERADVIPDREGLQQAVSLPGLEPSAAPGIDLNCGDGSPASQNGSE